MGIHVKPFPPTDDAFVAQVSEALKRVSSTVDRDPLGIPSESLLREALPLIRSRYPDVWICRQHVLASLDRGEIWYAFRDDGIPPGSHTSHRHA